MSSEQCSLNKEVFSVLEMAEYLGVSESKLRQLIRQKRIPFIRLDGQYKFYLPSIQKWLWEITTQPIAECSDDAHEIANKVWRTTEE